MRHIAILIATFALLSAGTAFAKGMADGCVCPVTAGPTAQADSTPGMELPPSP